MTLFVSSDLISTYLYSGSREIRCYLFVLIQRTVPALEFLGLVINFILGREPFDEKN